MRHCYPITEWTDTMPNYVGKGDTYHYLHHHGVAVESELMAYRIYFDKKQTIDPYCKRKPQLELAQSYWYPNDSLLAAGYGDDILRVSGTVGVGSVKYWNGKKMVHIEPVAQRSQRIVQSKRDQATIEVAVKDWQVEDKMVNMVTQYTMRAGHRDLRCDVSTSEPIEGLCTGVQSIPAKGQQPTANSQWLSEQLPNGILLASWGTDWPVNDSAKYTKETVGLAVFIPKEFAGELVHDKQNNLCLLRLADEAGLTKKSYSEAVLQSNGRSYSDSGLTAKQSEMCHAHFYLTCVGATKENHPVATSAEEWFAYLRRWAAKLK